MEITGKNKLIVREDKKLFEADLDLDLVHEIRETREIELPFGKTKSLVRTGYVSCKGCIVTKKEASTHEEAIANVNSVFAETLERALRGLLESFTSQVTYSFSIIKSSSPLLVTVELKIVTENRIHFEVVTSAGTYEDCYLNAKNLMREFIEELMKMTKGST